MCMAVIISEYADGSEFIFTHVYAEFKKLLCDFISEILSVFHFLIAFDEQLHRGKSGNANAREMDFETFLDFVLALENKDSPEGTTYLFKCLDLNGRVFLTTTDIHTLQ
ncbi:probable serine/threonine-protein phosphatase 2A regulatory subunit B'' subunit TON2, partial [Tanacetum coccineum]